MADQISLSLHSYAKDAKKKHQANENRMPSFHLWHSYAASSKKKRTRTSPTGHTPYSKEKRIALGPLTKQGVQVETEKIIRKKWTDEENNFILEQVARSKVHSNAFWCECAKRLQEKLSTSRSGESCRLQYKRIRSRTDHSEPALPFGTEGVSNQPQTMDASCQTDLSVPPERSRPDGKAVSPTTKHIAGWKHGTQEKTSHPAEILRLELEKVYETASPEYSVTDITNEMLNTNSIEDLSHVIFCNQTLKKSVWKMFLCDIQESSRSMCEKGKSYLFHKDYQSLKTFKWEEVIDEMVSNNPELVQVLLAVSVPKRKMADVKMLESVVKKLGFVYGILMKARWKDLSRIQRLISMVMCDEKVPQKVINNI